MPDHNDNWIFVQMLLTDADIALSFANIASDLYDPETVKWMIWNARATYDYIMDRRLSIPISVNDATTLESKLSALKVALVRLDEPV